jgi:hypothetical protein
VSPEQIAAYYALWYGRKPSEGEAAAIAREATLYADVTAAATGASLFDDEPSNYRHALAGRRGWRGQAR